MILTQAPATRRMGASVHSKPIVFVVDDDVAFLDSTSALLSSMGFAAKGYSSGSEFLRSYRDDEAGCLILDLNLSDMDGFAVLDELAKRPLSPPVIILTGKGTVRAAVRAVRHGVVAFLEKQSLSESGLWEAIQQSLRRDTTQRAAHRRRLKIQTLLEQLTTPEQLVLRLLVRGKEQSAIAEILGISRRTVANRRRRLMQKLEVSSLTELIKLADEAGLLDQ